MRPRPKPCATTLQTPIVPHLFSAPLGSLRVSTVVMHPAFEKLGYADAAILNAAAGSYLVLTDDGPLQGRAWDSGVDVLPFD